MSVDRFGGRIAVDFVFQELDYLPEGLAVPEGRVKPWGTNHAVMMAADAVHEPFAVINADDFYGAEAYKTIGDYLAKLGESRNSYCMVAYDLNKSGCPTAGSSSTTTAPTSLSPRTLPFR